MCHDNSNTYIHHDDTYISSECIPCICQAKRISAHFRKGLTLEVTDTVLLLLSVHIYDQQQWFRYLRRFRSFAMCEIKSEHINDRHVTLSPVTNASHESVAQDASLAFIYGSSTRTAKPI